MDHAARFILPDSLAGAPGCELPRRQTLPFLALAADIGHLDAAMPLRDRAERRSRFDRLELLGIAHQHDLGAALLGFGYHALHLTRADHSSLIDDQHVVHRQPLTPLRPLMFQTDRKSTRLNSSH